MKYNKMTNEKKDIIEKCIGIKIKGNNIKKNFWKTKRGKLLIKINFPYLNIDQNIKLI